MGKSHDLLKVRNVVLGIANALDVDSLGVVVDQGDQVLGLVAVGELGLDAEARQGDLELVVGATVEVGGRDNVISGLRKRGNAEELRGLA